MASKWEQESNAEWQRWAKAKADWEEICVAYADADMDSLESLVGMVQVFMKLHPPKKMAILSLTNSHFRKNSFPLFSPLTW